LAVGQRRPPSGRCFEETKGRELAEGREELATLPVEEQLIENPSSIAIAGFFRRDYGETGPRLVAMQPARVAPTLLWVMPDLPYLHFAVRLDSDWATQKKKPRGVIRLNGGPNAMGAFVGGIAAVGSRDITLDDLDTNARDDAYRSSWILHGRANVSVQFEGYLSCSLQAVAEGVRIRWIAISQSSAER
jgi:hypothetical protein